MYKRILAYVNAGETRIDQLEALFDLTVQLKSRLIVLAVIPPEEAGASSEETEKREALEDRTWKFLYQIEDVAFGREIRISLMLEDGEPEETIASVAKSYEANLCATFPYKEIDAERLIGRLGGVPLLLLTQEGR